MRTNNMKAILKARATSSLYSSLRAVVAFGQQTCNLTVGPATAPADGSAVPMWATVAARP